MPEPTRVRDDVTGHEYSSYGVYDGMTALEEPAVDERGELLPPKYPAAAEPEASADSEPAATTATTDSAPPAKKAAASPRTDTTKES